VAFTGHGALFDAQGNQVRATPDLILEIQRAYIDHLLDQAADPEVGSAFDQKRDGVLADQDWSTADRIHANAALITWLIDRVQPAEAPRLASINTALARQLAFGRAAGPDKGSAPSAAMQRNLDGEALRSPLAVTQASGQAYIDECKAAGVPIPPDWGHLDWKFRGILTEVFIPGGQAEVFVFEDDSPRGVCIALPRTVGNTITLLGIICQGNDTSKVCFWDNANVPKGAPVPLVNFKGGKDLEGGDVCSDCHAGKNAFVVHPNTQVDLGPIQKPNAWYEPIVPDSWPQNPGPTALLDGIPLGTGESACLACHKDTVAGGLPEVSTELSGYCGVFENAVKKTMPPGNPGAPGFEKHVQAIRAACKQPPSPSPPPPPPTASLEAILQIILMPLQ
jgi:hypothetical protein